jgi:hypothetical protein
VQIQIRSLDFSIDLIIMAVESTQPLTEMSNQESSWGKKQPAREADNLTAVCEPTV